MRKRPTGATVIGILNIIFGSLLLLCYVCDAINLGAGGSLFGGDNVLAERMLEHMKREVGGFMVVRVGTLVLGLIEAAVLLLTGIGLLNDGNWARVLAIFFAFVSMGTILAQTIFQFAVVGPAMSRFLRDNRILPPGPSPDFLVNVTNIVTAILALLLITYAIIQIAILLKPHIRDFYLGRDTGPLDDPYRPMPREDDDWYERRRSREDW